MPKKRTVDQYSQKQRIYKLIAALSHAFADKLSDRSRDKTDLIGYALQYLGRTRWRRSDFKEIENLTIKEIIDIFENNE